MIKNRDSIGHRESMAMVLRYTRSVTFDDCLEHYHLFSEGSVSYEVSSIFHVALELYVGGYTLVL